MRLDQGPLLQGRQEALRPWRQCGITRRLHQTITTFEDLDAKFASRKILLRQVSTREGIAGLLINGGNVASQRGQASEVISLASDRAKAGKQFLARDPCVAAYRHAL